MRGKRALYSERSMFLFFVLFCQGEHIDLWENSSLECPVIETGFPVRILTFLTFFSWDILSNLFFFLISGFRFQILTVQWNQSYGFEVTSQSSQFPVISHGTYCQTIINYVATILCAVFLKCFNFVFFSLKCIFLSLFV